MAVQAPRYKHLTKAALKDKIDTALELMAECRLCPRTCRVNRMQEETGFCTTGQKAVIASFAPHFGEEPPLVGTHGSGTIFFSHCNLKCCFCQNYDISIDGDGLPAIPGQIATIMLELAKKGCHNINLVTPSHVVPQFLQALDIAIDHGLTIPIVYNTSGYDSLDTLRLLNGVIDIYMPDVKFFDASVAEKFCQAADYPEVVRAALKEMYRQVGGLTLDTEGIAVSGLLVRHLVMPNSWSDTRNILQFLTDEISPDTHVNVMGQYRPMGNAGLFQDISRPVTATEYRKALDMARDMGLNLIR